MKSQLNLSATTSDACLTGTILYANVSFSGLADYTINAFIGGAIWMLFKLIGDFISYKYSNKRKQKEVEAKSRTENENDKQTDLSDSGIIPDSENKEEKQ